MAGAYHNRTPSPVGARLLAVSEHSDPEAVSLPLLGQPHRERADAARNRRRVLDAAARLFASRGPEAVAMDEVAAAAGVGKGTVYRRFGDRQGLLLALLDESERELQDALLSGEPPLGPGAPPDERLRSFLGALIELLEQRGEIIRASESTTPGARVRGGAYTAWHQHLALLVTELRPEADSEALAHVLLAPLAADSWTGLRSSAGLDRDRLARVVESVWLTAMAAPIRCRS
jgi:AcrR family transcriptional regulator